MTQELQRTGTAITIREYFADVSIEKFIASRHVSENTRRTYKNALLQAAKVITEPTIEQVDNFINKIRATKSPATLRLYATALKLYLSWAKIELDSEVFKLNLKQSKLHKKNALTQKQAQAMLKAITGNALKATRDRAITAISLSCGLRTCEISRADVGDIYFDGEEYFMSVQGKGRTSKDETIKIPVQVAGLIQKYLDLRGSVKDSAPLFVSMSRNSSKGNRMSAQAVARILKGLLVKIGVKKGERLSPHSTRHFAATMALKSNVDIREVSAMLRHSSLTVTMIYAHDLSVKTRRAECAVADALF